MGAEPGRGAALNDALAETLARVAEALDGATRPWWVIGSAAVALHGGATEVADVDVMVDPADIEWIMAATGAVEAPADGDALFRSARFLRWNGLPMPVEFMAGFRVRDGDGWRAVGFDTRVGVRVRGRTVWVPGREELRALLALFGRPKDVVRAAMLEG